VTIHELLRNIKFGNRKWKGEVLRFAMLQTHYLKPIDWTVRLLQQSESRLARWKDFAAERTSRRLNPKLRDDFLEALCDDLNTPAAFAIIDQACSSSVADERDPYTVSRLLNLLGFKNRKDQAVRLAEHLKPIVNKLSGMHFHDWAEMANAIAPLDKLTDDNSTARVFASLEALSDFYGRIHGVIAAKPQSELFDNLERFIKQHWALRESDFSSVYSTNFDGLIRQYLASEHVSGASPNVSFFLEEIPRFAGRRLANQAWERRHAEKLLELIDPVLNGLSRLNESDWAALAENVVRHPVFQSGEPKPETRLFAYLVAVALLGQHLRNYTVHADSEIVSRYYRNYFERLTRRPTVKERQIENLIELRNEARKAKDFEEADRIRDELAKMGVVLKDTKDGTTWEIAR
jgi:hypothetical protein